MYTGARVLSDHGRGLYACMHAWCCGYIELGACTCFIYMHVYIYIINSEIIYLIAPLIARSRLIYIRVRAYYK